MARKAAALVDIDRREVERHLRALAELLAAADQFEACGFDCAEERAQAQYYHARLTKIVDHIIEGKPVPSEG